ncbi:hypothetical protein LOK49_LG13G00944 [Camellia lanceoleosa]|uniref:Uncharacterized protein n=1 Tax=Camellia lanceoleosa TaxID=1840588 RepID=A0ACC0FHL4_9ERIC|nr:hypothetical protein LOK49_LG13G00944 [Camellia lanceoleosa]
MSFHQESCNNGASLFQYNGLRPVESKQATSVRSRTNGFISTSASKCSRIKAMSSPTVSAPKRETDPKKRIVITGMGLVSVFGNDIDTFYNKLLDGESGITLIDRFDASTFSVRLSWYCLVAGKRALEDAKLGPEVLETMDKTKIGVLVGTGMGGLTAFSNGSFRPWDKDRDGFVMGEDYGELRACNEKRSEYNWKYLGGAVTCDAHHMTDPQADGLGVSSCITKALEDAGVSPEEVNYVNAHATSTLAGDLAEVNALKKVFKDTSEMKMNGTKSMIGHGLGAAGGLEAIATIKAINTGWLHPTINQNNLEPDVTVDTVPNVKKQHEVNVAISNSFGFGGHNSVVAFTSFKP